ncbi:MAG: tRNA pseudouridine(13) synthase TruD [Thermoplasmatota archaeon]
MASAPAPATQKPQPPAAEQALGLGAYLTSTAGIGGHLRHEPEDFRVIELGDGPRPKEDGRFTAARIRLRNWETNRFAGQATRRMKLRRGSVGFAGLKDKRAVTEQWFTFKCPADRLDRLADLQDVEVLESYRAAQGQFAGAHDGNRFILRVRGHDTAPDAATVEATLDEIRQAGGVPNYFGPQRFGGGFRPITHLVGAAMVRGDLEEAVRLYVGHPMEGEREDTHAARMIYEETRDPEAALAAFPEALDPERGILQRLVKRPDEWRYALHALPRNLLQLFIHADQSFHFNHIITARLDAGLGLNEAHIGDQVMPVDADGTQTHAVTAANQARIQKELDRGRAVLTAPLVGMDCPAAAGEPGEIEAKVLEAHGVEPRDYRLREMPEQASAGRRRGLLQPVGDLAASWVDGDPELSFALGRGAYATVVMREVMKGEAGSY